MTSDYRRNHYVPQWYQKRFLPPGTKDQELLYLDLHSPAFTDPRGIAHARTRPRRLGFKHCFAEQDLYTTALGSFESTEIEQHFFGDIDNHGRQAVDYWTRFAHPWDGGDFFHSMMLYMSTQKLRTPKGLGWLGDNVGSRDKNTLLTVMLRLQQLHSAIWTESVWLIADANESNTKFIVSDHPVTVYNRRCGPQSRWCRGNSDPDIWLHATHTLFPLSLDRVLILTNLSWVRNPYQRETGVRPNPNPFRSAMFKYLDIQTLRKLSEQEVREINFVIKRRALRYIAAANDDWLYPERYVRESDWYRFGYGYLLMPDPRSTSYGGEIIIGHGDGTATAFDEYGRRPWDKDFKHNGGVDRDWETFHCFKGEFARLFGPYRRGRSYHLSSFDRDRDSDDYHQHHLDLENQAKKRLGRR